MIGPVVEVLAIVLLIATVTVLVLALAVVAVLGLLAFRVVRKAHRVVGWIRWPKQEKRPWGKARRKGGS